MAAPIAMPSIPSNRVQAWYAGRSLAAAETVLGNQADVRAFLRRSLTGGIEDALQETLARGIAAHRRFANRSSFRTYMLGVARYVVLETYRARARFEPRVPGAELEAPDTPCDEALHRRRAICGLQGSFGDLPPHMRESLHLYYWESLTAREIGLRLGISENTVRSRLRRGREQLRRRLQPLQ